MNNLFSQYVNMPDGTQIYLCSNRSFKQMEGAEVYIFNNGLVCDNLHWSHQMNYFEAQKKIFILHHYREHFLSKGIKKDIGKVNFAQIVEDMHFWISQLKLKKIHLLGHSMGVNISLRFAYLYPRKVKSLVLISGSVIAPQNQFKFKLPRQAMEWILKGFYTFPALGKGIWNGLDRFKFWHYIIWLGGFNVALVDSQYISEYIRGVCQLGPEIFFTLFKEIQKDTKQIKKMVPQIKASTLVVIGTNDKVIPAKAQFSVLKKLPNKSFLFLYQGSHVPQNEMPLLLHQKLDQFY